MSSYWEAIKMAFSGVLNRGTLLGLVIGVLAYGMVCLFALYLENTEFRMRLLARLQLRLGVARSCWARKMATRLWGKIVRMDCEMRYAAAIHAGDDGEQIWQMVQLPNLPCAKKRTVETCLTIAGKAGASKDVVQIAQECVQEIQRRERLPA